MSVTFNMQADILEQLLPNLPILQQTQQEILQRLMNSLVKNTEEPSPVGDPIIEHPLRQLQSMLRMIPPWRSGR